MNVIEEREREKQRRMTRSGSRSISWESLSKRLWSSPRSSVAHCLGYRIRFSTGRTSLQAPVRLGWLVSARRRPRCNAWMRFPSTHVYTHTHNIYTYKRGSSRLRHSRVPRVSLKVSLFSYVTKVRGISTSFFRNPIFSTDDLPIADSFHCFRSRRNKFLAIFHPLSFVCSNYTSVYVAFTLPIVLTFFNF